MRCSSSTATSSLFHGIRIVAGPTSASAEAATAPLLLLLLLLLLLCTRWCLPVPSS